MTLALLLLLGPAPSAAADLDASVSAAQEQVRSAADAQRPLAVVPPAPPADGGIPEAYRTPLPPAKDAPQAEAYCRLGSAADAGVQFCVNEAEYHGFELTDSAGPRIAPFGGAVHRDWDLMSPDHARSELGLLVYEWASRDAGADDSASSMLSEILFFPRRVVPSLRLLPGGAAYEVTLPTGETMLFDAKTKEVVGGVLAETGPIDVNPDRHARTFAALRYDGAGVMVRSDQRGDTPRSSVVWGIKKYATATWRGKTCRLSVAEVWKQDATGAGSDNLYPTDAAFYALLKRRCGWTVTDPSEAPRP